MLYSTRTVLYVLYVSMQILRNYARIMTELHSNSCSVWAERGSVTSESIWNHDDDADGQDKYSSVFFIRNQKSYQSVELDEHDGSIPVLATVRDCKKSFRNLDLQQICNPKAVRHQMLLSFGKRISYGASIRRNINYARYGSITRSNKNILSDCLQTRNPIALITELRRISSDGASPTNYPGIASATENLAEMIARLLICRNSARLHMAFQVLECLNEIKPEILIFGTYEIIDKCVEHGHIDDAMKAYERLQNMNIQLDVFRKERLMNALAPRCRVDDIIAVLTDHSITDNDLVLSAEPLIMSGKVPIYGSFLNKYLGQRSHLEDPLQCPDEVARVTRSIMAARLRRFFDSSEPSEDENDGMLIILDTLQTYHISLQCSPLAKHAGSLNSQSYFQSRQLCEIEKDRGLELIQTNSLSSHQLELMDHLPEFEVTGKFVMRISSSEFCHQK